MLHTYATPLDLNIGYSKKLQYLLVAINTLAVTAVLVLDVMHIVKVLMIFLILFWALKTHHAHNALRYLIWKNDNDWELRSLSGMQQLQLLRHSFVSSWFMVLTFQASSRQKLSLLIFNDAMDENQYRRLRVRLKVESAKLFSHAKIHK